MGLQFGHNTTANCELTATKRGELRHPRLRHAGDTPLEGFAWRKTPTTTGMENARGTESPAAVPMSSKNPATGPKGGRTSGTKLAQHTPSHRMSGTKFSLLVQNGSIWRVLPARGEFCTVLTTKKPSRESFGTIGHERGA